MRINGKIEKKIRKTEKKNLKFFNHFIHFVQPILKLFSKDKRIRNILFY